MRFRRTFRILLWVLIPLLSLALGTLGFTQFLGKPEVGVIRLSGVIWGEEFGKDMIAMLRYAVDTPSIRAVVLEIDSPGGGATLSEELYLNVLRLRSRKPVVVSVDGVAASGGYYTAAAGNFIYAKPTSYVGSIGAWTFMPEPEEISEDLVPTGPFKVTGGTKRQASLQLEMLKESFLQAIIAQREGKLKLSKEELSQAQIYNGLEGLRYGLVDAIGSSSDALDKAAELARLRRYKVVDINEKLEITLPTILFSAGSLPGASALVPTHLYLYLEPR